MSARVLISLGLVTLFACDGGESPTAEAGSAAAKTPANAPAAAPEASKHKDAGGLCEAFDPAAVGAAIGATGAAERVTPEVLPGGAARCLFMFGPQQVALVEIGNETELPVPVPGMEGPLQPDAKRGEGWWSLHGPKGSALQTQHEGKRVTMGVAIPKLDATKADAALDALRDLTLPRAATTLERAAKGAGLALDSGSGKDNVCKHLDRQVLANALGEAKKLAKVTSVGFTGGGIKGRNCVYMPARNSQVNIAVGFTTAADFPAKSDVSPMVYKAHPDRGANWRMGKLEGKRTVLTKKHGTIVRVDYGDKDAKPEELDDKVHKLADAVLPMIPENAPELLKD